MLTRLRIQNFKSLADTGEMQIRPLTFLVGPNSAGKSSLLQVMLLLRQTVDERDPNITLKINGSWVELGSYLDCIHRAVGEEPGNRELEISFTFLWPKPDYGGGVSLSDLLSTDFNARFGYDGKVLLQRASYKGDIGEFAIERVGFQQYRVNGDTNVQLRKFYDCSPPPFPKRPEKPDMFFPSKQVDLPFSSFQGFVWGMEYFFSRVFYLGPLRHRPQSSYQTSGEVPTDVGLAGERAIDVLMASAKRGRESTLTQVRHWLDAFDIASDVQLTDLTPTQYQFRLIDKPTGVTVNYPHVGFGAFQIVPIIVEGFYSLDLSTLLIEQPEIHLHPRAQARLADLLIAVSQESRSLDLAPKTLIVETHSEHLLSQVQVRIAQGDLSRDDVAIYYFEPTPAGTRIVPIEINELGQFGNWPPGFFDEGFKLADAHFRAIARAQELGNDRD
jgi:hypothetical protein